MFANVIIAAIMLASASSTATRQRSLARNVQLRSSGFGVMSEKSGVLELNNMMNMKMKSVRNGGKISLMGVEDTKKLVSSTGAQVLKSRLFSASSHMRDAVLKIEDLTNSVEMGFKKVEDLKFTAADIQGLDKNLEKPLSKVSSAMQTASEDLTDNLAPAIHDAVKKAIRDGTDGIAAAKASSAALGHGDVNEGINQLNKMRAAADGLDGIVGDQSLWK